jgi:glycosyltransferase involved in cell wall biosynthesis
MNILILSWRGPRHPNAGGAEVATEEHAKTWVKKGHKVTLFTSYVKSLPKEEYINGIKVIRRGTAVLGVRIAFVTWFLFKKHQKFDLVVDEFHGIPFFTPLFVRSKKMAWIHEVAKEVWTLNPWPRPLNLIPAFFGYYFEPFLFNLYRNIPFMTVSDSTKKDLVAWGISPKNITVIHNGATLLKRKPKTLKQKHKTLIFLGALSRDKGIEDALKVFSLIIKTKKDWQFWVVGQGEDHYLNHLKNISRQLNIQKKVKFWGFVSEAMKFKLLASSHIMINPSTREGWGLVNIEANSVGIPVVGYKVPGMVDSIQNSKTGILVKKGDYKVMAKEIISLSSSKNYLKMKKEAVRWSKKFNWSDAGKKSLRLIESI